jgi:hypothetical protein
MAVKPYRNMRRSAYLFVVVPLVLAACGSSKTYFTTSIRRSLEASHQKLEKVQFYADRDIVLRREMDKEEAKVNSGKVKIENGHYISIITLKKNTLGVCTVATNNAVGISFEQGNNKFLSFGKTKDAEPEDPYRILATEWVDDYGIITYEGKQYHIQADGTEASLMIKTKFYKKLVKDEREMKGRKVAKK